MKAKKFHRKVVELVSYDSNINRALFGKVRGIFLTSELFDALESLLVAKSKEVEDSAGQVPDEFALPPYEVPDGFCVSVQKADLERGPAYTIVSVFYEDTIYVGEVHFNHNDDVGEDMRATVLVSRDVGDYLILGNYDLQSALNVLTSGFKALLAPVSEDSTDKRTKYDLVVPSGYRLELQKTSARSSAKWGLSHLRKHIGAIEMKKAHYGSSYAFFPDHDRAFTALPAGSLKPITGLASLYDAVKCLIEYTEEPEPMSKTKLISKSRSSRLNSADENVKMLNLPVGFSAVFDDSECEPDELAWDVYHVLRKSPIATIYLDASPRKWPEDEKRVCFTLLGIRQSYQCSLREAVDTICSQYIERADRAGSDKPVEEVPPSEEPKGTESKNLSLKLPGGYYTVFDDSDPNPDRDVWKLYCGSYAVGEISTSKFPPGFDFKLYKTGRTSRRPFTYAHTAANRLIALHKNLF